MVSTPAARTTLEPHEVACSTDGPRFMIRVFVQSLKYRSDRSSSVPAYMATADPAGIELLIQAAEAIERSPNARDTRTQVQHPYARNHNDSNSSAGDGGSGGSGHEEPRGRRAGGTGTRETHNKLEKNRRAHMKECFEDLKKEIPSLEEKKTSNLSILRQSYKYIQSLKRTERQYENVLHQLTTEKIRLLQRLNDLKKEVEDRFGNGAALPECTRLVEEEEEEDGAVSDSTTSVASDGANFLLDASSDVDENHEEDDNNNMEVDSVETEPVPVPSTRPQALKPAPQPPVMKVLRQPIIVKPEVPKSPSVPSPATPSNVEVAQKLRKKLQGSQQKQNAQVTTIQISKMAKGTQHARIMTPPKVQISGSHQGSTISPVPIPMTTITRTVQPAMVTATTLLPVSKTLQAAPMVLPSSPMVSQTRVIPQVIMGAGVMSTSPMSSGHPSTILLPSMSKAQVLGTALSTPISVATTPMLNHDTIPRPALAVARGVVSPVSAVTTGRLPLSYAPSNMVGVYQPFQIPPLVMVPSNIMPKTTVPTTSSHSS